MAAKKVEVYENSGKEEKILEGFLSCKACGREYPIIEGIPRLCLELLEDEKNSLVRIRETRTCTKQKNKSKEGPIDYDKIEKLVREIVIFPEGENRSLIERIENDINFRVKECEKQEKYVNTLKLYYNKPLQTILDVGGGQGGLIKCFNEHFPGSLCIMLDYELLWVEVAKLRNPEVQIIRADACRLPFAEDSIDLVLSTLTLEHIREYDNALNEMCRVAGKIFFISWGPNKLSLYDFGHLHAPITIFPKKIAAYIAFIWYKIRRVGRPMEGILSDLENIYYISTRHVYKKLKQYGKVFNVFVDFALFSLTADYSYRMGGAKYFLKIHPKLSRSIFTLLKLLCIEPQCYYILMKEN